MSTVKHMYLNIMHDPHYAIPLFGFVVPPLALLVLILNGCLFWVITRRNMRSPANILLVCISISDTISICLPLPLFVYFYTFGNYEDFVPYSWCGVFYNFVHVFPLLCNMASLWATVALACIRCYSVWRPLKTRTTITIRRTYVAVILTYALSIAVYGPLTLKYEFTPKSVPSNVLKNASILTCDVQVRTNSVLRPFWIGHTWVQIIFTSVMPWILITFPNFGMVWKLKQAVNARKMLNLGTIETDVLKTTGKYFANRTKSDSKHAIRDKAKTHRTTLMICIVVTMVWLVEIPFAIVFARYLLNSNGDVLHIDLGVEFVVAFLLKYVTYPLIFPVYCFMSAQVRHTFKDCFLCKKTSFHWIRGTTSR